jgi:hypothetical protein
MTWGVRHVFEFILDLAARVEQHDDRLKRLEEQARQDSRTSSKSGTDALDAGPVLRPQCLHHGSPAPA